jgi:hypothetical protein
VKRRPIHRISDNSRFACLGFVIPPKQGNGRRGKRQADENAHDANARAFFRIFEQRREALTDEGKPPDDTL